MPDALELLTASKNQHRPIRLLLTDKRPPARLVAELNQNDSKIRYLDRSIDTCLPLMNQLEAMEPSGCQ